MKKRINILYLYSEVVGYLIPIFAEYVNKYNAIVHVVHWDERKLKPYEPVHLTDVFYYKRSQYSKKQLLVLVNSILPDIVYISGWMDKGYLYVAKFLKSNGIPVVCGFDDVWKGTLRQRIGSFLFPIVYRKYFTHAWVAGPYQYEFASKLGFKRNKIIFDLLSADTNSFKIEKRFQEFLVEPPNAFLYVGNFRYIKGFDILIDAFKKYKYEFKGDWKLICVGNGELEHLALDVKDVIVYPFTDTNNLIKISKEASFFILPSRNDQWGVVIHEFTSLGMPLIISENVGSRSLFFIDSFNGFIYRNNSVDELAKTMKIVSKLPKDQIIRMGKNSEILSRKVSIESTAANFMSVLKNY